MRFLQFLFLACTALLILPPAAASGATARDLIAAVRNAPAGQVRQGRFYELATAMHDGGIELDAEGAAQLAEFLVNFMLDPETGPERQSAAELCVRNAHPLMADPLLRYIQEQPQDPLHLRSTAYAVLARLRDARVLGGIVNDLQADDSGIVMRAVELLVDLGDARAIAPLRTLAADSSLAMRLGAGQLSRRRANGRGVAPNTEPVPDLHGAQRVFGAAALAARQLQLLADRKIACGFALDQGAMDALAEQGFVVLPRPCNELFECYSDEYPYVTTDFAYHTWMILVRAAYDDLEHLWLRKSLGELSAGMCRALKGDDAAFFAVPAVLTGAITLKESGLSAGRAAEVERELARIRDAAVTAPSRILGTSEDYTEYRPRGRFSTGDPGYFQALTWLGRAFFPADDPARTKQALRLVQALYGDPVLVRRWAEIAAVMDVLGGPPDDPTPADYLHVAETISGRSGVPAVAAVLDDSAQLIAFRARLLEWPAPRIHTGTGPSSGEQAGLRFLGQRYTRDAHLFQEIIAGGEWPPSGLHALAGLLGSARATEWLGKTVVPPATTQAGGPSIMEAWFACHASLFAADKSLPAPFDTDAWRDKELNSALGAWAETRHAAAPYTKAAHDYLGMSMMTDRIHGFVDPYPEFFLTLAHRAAALDSLLAQVGMYDAVEAAQAAITRELDASYGPQNKYGHRESKDVVNWREQYDDELRARHLDRKRLPEFVGILNRLGEISAKGRAGEPQSVEDGMFLKGLADRMRRLSFNESSSAVAEESMARIIDVATEYSHDEVLLAGVGQAMPIYVAVPDGDRKVVCRGGVYSYYEFVEPRGRRLDDATWDCIAGVGTGAAAVPWLERVAKRVYRNSLSRADLIRLRDAPVDQDYASFASNRRPWVFAIGDHLSTPRWVGACTSQSDVDVLLEIYVRAGERDPRFLFAVTAIAGHSEDPRARALFAAETDRILGALNSRRLYPTEHDVAVLFLAIDVLGASTEPSDRARLEGIAHSVEITPNVNEGIEERESCFVAALARVGVPVSGR